MLDIRNEYDCREIVKKVLEYEHPGLKSNRFNLFDDIPITDSTRKLINNIRKTQEVFYDIDKEYPVLKKLYEELANYYEPTSRRAYLKIEKMKQKHEACNNYYEKIVKPHIEQTIQALKESEEKLESVKSLDLDRKLIDGRTNHYGYTIENMSEPLLLKVRSIIKTLEGKLNTNEEYEHPILKDLSAFSSNNKSLDNESSENES